MNEQETFERLQRAKFETAAQAFGFRFQYEIGKPDPVGALLNPIDNGLREFQGWTLDEVKAECMKRYGKGRIKL